MDKKQEQVLRERNAELERELEIEASLENVRMVAMAMQNSEDLAVTIDAFHRELEALHIAPKRFGVALIDGETRIAELCTKAPGESIHTIRKAALTGHPVLEHLFETWLEQKEYYPVLRGNEIKAYHQVNRPNATFADYPDDAVQYGSFFSFSEGGVWAWTDTPLPEKVVQIYRRFTKVLHLTYKRYKDLKLAEEQTREAQTEAALERVRTVAMGMRTPDDLLNISKALFNELRALAFGDLRNAMTQTYFNEQNYLLDYDYSDFMKGHINHVSYKGYPIVEKFIQDIQKSKDAFAEIVVIGDELEKWKNFRSANNETPDERLDQNSALYYYFYSVGDTSIGISAFSRVPDDKLQILKRFRNVFDLAYRRYVDIKQAEEQAREAQIEAALEKVRSRSLAMHKTDELNEVVSVVFEKLHDLGIVMDQEAASIVIFTEGSKNLILWNAIPDQAYSKSFHIPYYDTAVIKTLFDAKIAGIAFFERNYTSEEKDHFWQWAVKYSDYKNIPDERKKQILESEHFACSVAFTKNSAMLVSSYKGKLLSEKEGAILKRFARVFEQAYVRFLDLQKAEEQARESQIQLALERVRARTMAMQKSDELSETVYILFQQFKELGENPDQATIGIINEKEHVIEYWVTMYGNQENKVFKFSIDEPNVTRKIYEGWKKHKKSLVIDLGGKALLDFAAYRQSMGGAKLNKYEKRRIINVAFFSKGLINVQSTEERSEESVNLLERFAGVFDGTYTRFLDLQKAEAQAREAKIETSLERVRAAAMAMHDSAGVSDATALVFTELYKLGINTIRCGVCIVDGAAKEIEVWSASQLEGKLSRGIGRLDMTAHPLWIHLLNAWKARTPSFTYELKDQELADYYHIIRTASGYHAPYNKAMYNPAGISSERQYCNCYIFKEGCLFTFTNEPFSHETGQVLEKFAAVFGLTYRRYLDLQKAEAQARESQIEAALERVRSKTMAMHNSADVGETVTLMFNELVKLGVDKIARCGIAIPDNTGVIELWTAKLGKDEKEEMIIGHVDTSIHPMLTFLLEAWKSKQADFEYLLEGDDLTSYITAINNSSGYPIKYDMGAWGAKQYHNDFFFHEGMVFAFTALPLSVEIVAIFKRFAGVFGQTYRRYLDLQKAEAQVREAQIEAALERVRSKAMAMRSSSDLNTTSNIVFVELRKLGIDLVRCGVGLMEKNIHVATIHAATNSAEGSSLEVLGTINMDLHPVCEGIYRHWEQNKDYFPVLEGESLTSYYKALGRSSVSVPDWKSDDKQYGYFLPFADGSLYAWSGKQESEATVKTLKRFASVFGLTHTRYLELKRAELNTKEAIKQASLDRVRAEIASMRTRGDLERITPLIWEELTVLGIPFIRCGVFIMDEAQQLIHTFLSTPDGQAIGAFHVSFDASRNFENIVENWRLRKSYTDHWDLDAFEQFAETLLKQGAITSKTQYLKTMPGEGIYLNFLPFLQGMLYVGNAESLSDDNLNLVQAVADAFSTAYARYEDFNKLEAAKQEVDNTLTQLKATQNKLIQSEKMASLGELTAGIAHEIQNPLNFVNNFSEVSAELIDEMDEELGKGDIEEAKAIASDIRDNLKKIRHHGGRADGIVKGMLQHSRASSNVKEPTDINKLADEYLHLAYHGLRAKDKSFNADLITNFDEKLPKIEAVPQDIGRVILNMLNNAFYAIQQKAKTAGPDYKPVVKVKTLADKSHVTISIKDNGSGIPESVKEKIMQPFFTTKPTGEGTGLGLSLSYDIIVKGHGGKINIESKEGEGSEFIIDLPIA